MRSYTRTEGVIKDVPRSPATTRVRYAPLVAFKAEDGKEYSFFDERVYRNPPPKHLIGKRVGICYSPHDPSNAVILNASLFGIPAAILIGGVVMIGIAISELI